MFKKVLLVTVLALALFASNAQSQITYSAFGMDFDQNTGELYAYDNDTIALGRIDPANGSFETIAPISGDLDVNNFNIVALAFDPTDGAMYCTDAQRIFTIDVSNGVTALVGELIGGDFESSINFMISIDIDNDGQMYGFEFDAFEPSGFRGDNGRLWSIEKTTGSMSALGSSGVMNVGFVQGMDFDPDTNILHSAIFAFDGSFPLLGDYGTWDLSVSGAATFTALAPLSDAAQDMELVFAISEGVAYGHDVFNDVFGKFNVGDIASWTPILCSDICVADVTAASITVLSGNIGINSGVEELQKSDDFDLQLFTKRPFAPAGPQTVFVAESVSPTSNPTMFSVTLEGSVFSRRAVTQSISLWNYESSSYEEAFSGFVKSFLDNTVTAKANGDLSRFVGPGNAIQVQVLYEGSANNMVFASNTDHLFWEIEWGSSE